MMSDTWSPPPGYSTVSPYLIVDGAAGTIAFLSHVLGAVEVRRVGRPDDLIMHAEVRLGESILMLADATKGWPAIPSHVHVYVPDVDAAYQRALDAGATSVQEPEKKADEDRRAGVTDPGGTTWWIATRVE